MYSNTWLTPPVPILATPLGGNVVTQETSMNSRSRALNGSRTVDNATLPHRQLERLQMLK